MPASIFSETELARLASFPEEIPGDDLIRAFALTGADRDLVAIRRGGSKPLGARASALCTSLPRLRSAQFERSCTALFSHVSPDKTGGWSCLAALGAPDLCRYGNRALLSFQ